MAQIYVELNDNKSIKDYSTNAQEGFIAVTIDDADAYSLAEYSSLMWVDENNLVHADNLPTTKYQQNLNQIKADIANDIQSIQAKIDAANQASTVLDAKIQTANDTTNKMIWQVQLQFAKQLAAVQAANKPATSSATTSASDTSAK